MKINESKQRLKVIQNIMKHVDDYKWECICVDCNQPAINSHLLQQHGILSNIAENGQLWEVGASDVMKWDKSMPFDFKKRGLSQAISHKLLCKEHDDSLFKKIESKCINCDDYETQLLLSYRVVLSELRKKEKSIMIAERMKNSATLSGHDEFYDAEITGCEISKRDISLYRDLLNEELNQLGTQNPNLIFNHYTFPKLGIYASSHFSFETDAGSIIGTMNAIAGKMWDSMFIHIIPLENTTEIITGYHKDHNNKQMVHFATSWSNLNLEDLGFKLTKLFAAHIENWGLSPSLYESILPKNKRAYIQYMTEHARDYNMFQQPSFNLFEGCWSQNDNLTS